MDERAELIERIVGSNERFIRALNSGGANPWLTVDLTMPQLKILLLVFSAGSATAGHLARGLGVGLSTTTGIVDRLVDQDLVRRYEDSADRRVTRVELSATGQALIERLLQANRDRFRRLLARLDEAQLRTLDQGVSHLLEAALAESEADGREGDGETALDSGAVRQ